MTDPIYADLKKWPYPVHYGKENEIETDVLFIGGGIAGSHGAISAAKKGARVAVVDKGPVIRSGLGGAGVDHWHLPARIPHQISHLTKSWNMFRVSGIMDTWSSETASQPI